VATRGSRAHGACVARVTERVRSPCVGHLLGFWVPVEIRGRSLVRWKALVMAYMPIYFFSDFFLYRRERCITCPNPAQDFLRFSDFLHARWCHAVFDA
jgi:hypothetical protein